jgi:outer membrane cobalamin receptor
LRGSALAALALMAAAPTRAQQASAGPASAVADIVVTGSRIVRTGFHAPTPTTVMTGTNGYL